MKTYHLRLVVLTKNPKNLVQVRINRLNILNQDHKTNYADIETVQEEIRDIRWIFTKNNWPVVDGTQKSIEEIAAIVFQHYAHHREGAS